MSNSFIIRVSIYDVKVGSKYVIYKYAMPKKISTIDADLRIITAYFHNSIHTFLEHLL